VAARLIFSGKNEYDVRVMQIPKRKPGKYSGDPADNYLSLEAIAKLLSDIEHIEKISRPRAVTDLQKAADMGDRSDNAAYSDARGRLTGLDIRLQTFKERLKYAIPIQVGVGSNGMVRLGSTVTIEVNGKSKTYNIVGAQEANPTSGRISYHSPLGQSLMGHRAGETISIEVNGKAVAYQITEVA
jgi:transcription elongation GreA/GreB family factor